MVIVAVSVIYQITNKDMYKDLTERLEDCKKENNHLFNEMVDRGYTELEAEAKIWS